MNCFNYLLKSPVILWWCHFITQYIQQDLFKCLRKKKKRSCLFSPGTARRKKAKKSFSSDWAEKLAESDKRSYFDQEQWLKELNEQPSAECNPSVSSSTCSASRSKITVEEPLADLESTETWQNIHGHVIIAGERLQEKMNESVTCCFCQGSV